MRILLLSGNHSRHLFVHQAVLECGAECAAIVMERESLVPAPPSGLAVQDRNNFKRHFRERQDVEQRAFGTLSADAVFSGCQVLHCSPSELNTQRAADFARAFAPDLAFIFGPDLIKEPLFGALPEDRVNMHLGLSPWYRGSATLFWPFYFLQPQFAGVTFHQIVAAPDAGGIVHQCVPELLPGDGIHEVGARAVLKGRDDLRSMLDDYQRTHRWEYRPQLSSGRLFLNRDFKPVHLRVIYDLFDNAIVDQFLDGALNGQGPPLVQYGSTGQ